MSGSAPPRQRGGEGSQVEHSLLPDRRRGSQLALGLSLGVCAVFVVMATRDRMPWIQSTDDAFLRAMLAVRSKPLTWIADVFNVVGGIFVTLPIRIGVAGYLAWKRRWYHFSAFVLAMVTSEVLISLVKTLYDRQRPPAVDQLVTTSSSSFPSGHAIATSVTAVAIVIALFPEGKRLWGGMVAAALSYVMALSRAYLAAHWLSDVIAGVLLGTAVAVDAAWVVQEIWDLRLRRARARAGDHPAGRTPVPGG